MLIFAFLCCFAFLAGLVDAMVGGGGLIQLPALFILMPQLSLVNTLATNKTASFLGTLVATVRYIKHVKIDWKQLAPAMISAFVGSLCGALLVSRFQKTYFMPFIIVALLVVLFFTLLNKNMGLLHVNKNLSNFKVYFYAVLTGLFIGMYDGLIGPGTGSFLIFAFVLFFGLDFLHASANAKIINCITNISALLFFLFKGYILWSIAIPVGLANMAGNYVGSHLALSQGNIFIRIFFIAVVSVLIFKLGYDYLGKFVG